MDTSSLLTLPVLPLRDIVVFPGMHVPLFVGREKSVKALEQAPQHDGMILLVAQKNGGQDDPGESDLFHVGTVARIQQTLRMPDGTMKVLVIGIGRAKILHYLPQREFFQVRAEAMEEEIGDSHETEALFRSIVTQFEQYVKLKKTIQPEILGLIGKIDQPSQLADTVMAHMVVDIPKKQRGLEMTSITERLEFVFGTLEAEISVLNTERRIRSRVKRQMEKTQREYYLNEQMKAIQKELGEGEEGRDEVTELEDRLKKLRLNKEAKEKVKVEAKKLRMMSPMSAEAGVIRNYLEWIASLPWKRPTRLSHDLKRAEAILDEDHYGLEKVKERILEYLAVQQRTKTLKGPILCLVGPPGVGKTSLARSIARATGRNYVRISLGGVRDEAEVRGHRRTYIGSMPGKIIQSMKKAKSSNPLLLLDEIDKLGADWRGDPASALLEVLDPEQNAHFSDHYLELDYDLSQVLFIATANSYNMPRPLLDRMEVIRIPGYTEEEKMAIAENHLIPKQVSQHGLKKGEWTINDEALRELIRTYTREAGVRNLERELANLARKSVKEILMKGAKRVAVTKRNIAKMAGVPKYMFGQAEKIDQVGITTGLAYTDTGGDLLLIESVTLPGRGKITITGKLGDVMQESVQAAWSYVRARAQDFGIPLDHIQQKDIHVHVPEGATPKDGPSAGIAICTTIVSLLTGIPVRRDIAMTGEITLRGRVLAIGGLKEKLLAALRGGITTVLIPEENVKDLADIPDNVKRDITIIPVATVDEVLKAALTAPVEPKQWIEIKPDVAHKNEAKDKAVGTDGSGVIAH